MPEDQIDAGQTEAERAAIAAVQAFVTAFNAQDHTAIAASFNFPHVRLAKGRFFRFESVADYLEYAEARHAGLAEEGWHHTVLRSVRVVQSGAEKVHLAIHYDRCHDDGTVYSPFDTLWIATLLDGKWGIQFRSSFLRT